MKKPFQVYLKAGERLFVNGAVIRVDRKVSIEFLNDVAFLLESNVLQADEATTPLRQFYFVIQTVLIDGASAEESTLMLKSMYQNLMSTFTNRDVRQGLTLAHELCVAGRLYEALRTVKSMYPIEAEILGRRDEAPAFKGAMAACK